MLVTGDNSSRCPGADIGPWHQGFFKWPLSGASDTFRTIIRVPRRRVKDVATSNKCGALPVSTTRFRLRILPTEEDNCREYLTPYLYENQKCWLRHKRNFVVLDESQIWHRCLLPCIICFEERPYDPVGLDSSCSFTDTDDVHVTDNANDPTFVFLEWMQSESCDSMASADIQSPLTF